MEFAVTYRDAKGSVSTEVVVATSRAECFAKCKARGISPIKVEEDAVKTHASGKRQPVKALGVSGNPSASRRLVIGGVLLVLLVAAGIVAWLLCRGGTAVPQPRVRPPQRAKTLPPPKAETNAVQEAQGNVLKPRKIRAAVVHKEPELTKYTPPPKVDALDLIKNSTVISNTVKSSRVLFKSRAENLLAGIISAKPGYRVIDIPLDAAFVEDFKRSLGNPIRLDDQDTPEEAELKQAVVDVKAQLLDEMDKGGDISRIISDAREDLNRLADYRKEIQMAYSAFVREGHPPDECEAFRKEANELLKEYELDPLDEPGRKPKGRKSARKESGK